jgi:hypothetical protein
MEYTWEPIDGWAGRYRCQKTGVIGYKGIVTKKHHTKISHGTVYPYVCHCGKPAVTHKKGKSFYCKEHGK